jgi:hypothetical protein
VVVVLAVIGCVRPDLPTCGELTCPPGTACVADLEICASPAAVAACTGSAAGTVCSDGDIDGSCESSMDVDGGEVCVGEVCGDDQVTGREQCDGSIGASTCADFGYYFGDLGCTSSCLYDFDGCSGRCGDHVVQSPIEDCDGGLPAYTCVGRGFDYGHLQCTSHCSDSSLIDCGDFTPRALLGMMLGTIGTSFDSVYTTADVSVFATTNGLTVFDRGVETDFTSAGNVHAIIGANGTIYIADGNEVDELAGDSQNLSLQPTPGAAPFGAGTTIYGLAADSHATLYAVAADCTWATFDGTQWTPQAMPVPSINHNCAVPRAIVVSASDEVYAVDATGGASYLQGSSWVAVKNGEAGHLNPAGPDGHALLVGAASGATSGIFELVGDTAQPISIAPPGQDWPQTWTDAIALVHPGSSPPTYEYLALTPASAWWLAPNAPPIELGQWDQVGVHLGLMPDGHVVTWGAAADVLTPMTSSLLGLDGAVSLTFAGVAAYGTSFIGWSDTMSGANQVVDVLAGGPPDFMSAAGEQIADVSVSGGDIYIASDSAAYYSAGPSMQSTLCTFSGTEAPTSIAGTGGRNGYVATFDRSTMATAMYEFQTSLASTACTSMAPPPGRVIALATSASGELYAAVLDPPMLGVEHLDTQTNTWEALHAIPDNQGKDLAVLPDGTIVLCGQDHISIGVASNGLLTWTDLATGARRASGTSATDIWFTEAVAREAVMAGLAHWNGNDLAPVNEITTSPSAAVAATPDVVMLANGANIYALVRFPIQ